MIRNASELSSEMNGVQPGCRLAQVEDVTVPNSARIVELGCRDGDSRAPVGEADRFAGMVGVVWRYASANKITAWCLQPVNSKCARPKPAVGRFKPCSPPSLMAMTTAGTAAPACWGRSRQVARFIPNVTNGTDLVATRAKLRESP